MICQLCQKPSNRWEAHEWFLKRGSVPRNKQEHIFCIENCVPLCRSCHEEFGQTLTGLKRLLLTQSRYIGSKAIARWYRALPKHGISISPRGLITEKEWPPTLGLAWAHLVARMNGVQMEGDWTVPTEARNQVDWRSWVFYRWQGKKPRWGRGTIVSEVNGLSRETFEAFIDEGYWLQYLASVKGITLGELMEIWRTYRS